MENTEQEIATINLQEKQFLKTINYKMSITSKRIVVIHKNHTFTNISDKEIINASNSRPSKEDGSTVYTFYRPGSEKPRLYRSSDKEIYAISNNEISQISLHKEDNKLIITTNKATKKYNITDINQIPVLIEALQKVYGEKFHHIA